ncbi:hypothetical protein [Prauserella rugosa]|nr:hypothetical protein [Prauserella rugosa]
MTEPPAPPPGPDTPTTVNRLIPDRRSLLLGLQAAVQDGDTL